MSASFYDLLKYAKTGIASPPMAHYDKLKALAMCKAGFPITSLTGVDEIQFDSDGKPLISWYVKGNEVQEGTPAPDNIIMPEECGDPTANLVRVASDNYIAYSTYTYFTIVGDTVVTSGNVLIGFLAKVKPNTDYAVAFDNSSGYAHLRIRTYSDKPTSWSDASYIDQPVNVQGSTSHKSGTFTTTSETEWVLVCMYVPSAYSGTVISNIMLNSGSTAKSYEPFGYKLDISCGGTQNVYLQEPIRKIGDSSDVASAVGTVGTATRGIRKKMFDGSEDWAGFQDAGTRCVARIALSETDAGLNSIVGYCSHIKWKSSYASADLNRIVFNDARIIYLSLESSLLSENSLAAFKSYLAAQYAAGTPICLWYVLATPTEETFTAPTITPQKGSNTLTVDTTLPPSEVSITGGIK